MSRIMCSQSDTPETKPEAEFEATESVARGATEKELTGEGFIEAERVTRGDEETKELIGEVKGLIGGTESTLLSSKQMRTGS